MDAAIAHIPLNDTVYTVRTYPHPLLDTIVTVDSNSGRESDWACISKGNKLTIMHADPKNLTPWKLVKAAL
jgi:hypothetical protein